MQFPKEKSAPTAASSESATKQTHENAEAKVTPSAQPSKLDPYEHHIRELEALQGILKANELRDILMPELGYSFEPGTSPIMVTWRDNPNTKRELVGWLHLDKRTLQVLPDQADTHTELIDVFAGDLRPDSHALDKWGVCIGDEPETCPECNGIGGFVVEDGYKVTGPGMGDAEPVERDQLCELCEGTGEVEL